MQPSHREGLSEYMLCVCVGMVKGMRHGLDGEGAQFLSMSKKQILIFIFTIFLYHISGSFVFGVANMIKMVL